MEPARAQHEADQSRRIDVENAQRIKTFAQSRADLFSDLLKGLQQDLKDCDPGDTQDLNEAANHVTATASILRTVAARPISPRQ